MLHQVITKALIRLHDVAHQATQTAIKTATDKENIPEHKYDTLSLEAAYLAHGQAQRVEQCLQDIRSFKALIPQTYSQDDEIGLGALVELYDVQQECSKWFFISPVAGGLNVEFNHKTIHLITLASPLGQSMNKKYVDDDFVLKVGENSKNYEVIRLF